VPAPTRERAEAAATARARVLVIDDEEAIGRAIARTLRRQHDVRVMTSGRDALAAIAGGSEFDIIFCDLNMPHTSGAEVHHTLRQTRPDLARKIVFLTGQASSPKAQAFIASTGNPFLAKPFAVESLRTIVADSVKSA
jgi:CheY-like chemotaxis protein